MEALPLSAARYEFTATRDDAGVPHVEAASWHEALYALGYLHAVDRPTQICFSRAVASGRACERIANKPELLEMDRLLRRVGLYRGLAEEADALAPRIGQQVDWYCRGVNDGMQELGKTALGKSLPMWMTGFNPQPWDAEAVLLIGALLSFAGLAVGQQEAERQMIELIQLEMPAGGGDDLLRELFSPYLDGIDFEPLRALRIEKRLSDDALELLSDLPRLAGSNAWAVSPQRSATGSALLASDPHLEVNRLPAIWYEVALSWGDGPRNEREYAVGATLPGCPLMAVGRTRRLAWGVTYLNADTSDLFIEDCRPDTAGGFTGGWQYRRNRTTDDAANGDDPTASDHWLPFDRRTETILRKGAGPVELEVFENDLGTLTDTPTEVGHHLSSRWVGAHEGSGRSIGVWLDVLAADSVEQAMSVVRDTPHPSLVWVLADRDGHIGKQASGWVPQRPPGRSGMVPQPAWDPANHWTGIIPSELLPSEYDPPIGFVASANEELYRTDGLPLHGFGLSDYRKRRIVKRLTEMPRVTVADMQSLQYDVTSKQAKDLLPVLLAHVDDCPLKRRLEAWDRRYTPDSTEAVLFTHFYRHVLLEILGHEEGIGWRRMFYLSTRMGYSPLVLTAADRVLPKLTSGWWRKRDKGAMIRAAAARAIAEPAQKWGDLNYFHFTNRFLGEGVTGRLLGMQSARTAMPGCHASPFQGHLLRTKTRESTFAPSYHFVTDLATDEAWTNLPGGPSESAFSKWYQSDVARWTAGEYKRLTPRVGDDD
ncbi:MAG: penicillin acylase family protein [Planctomycetota bacterium]